eukprot:332504-Pyramimonas_sp.AAC.1
MPKLRHAPPAVVVDVVCPNHPVVLGLRFEQTPPRVTSLLVALFLLPSFPSSLLRSSHAFPPPSTTFCGPIGRSTEGPNGAVLPP